MDNESEVEENSDKPTEKMITEPDGVDTAADAAKNGDRAPRVVIRHPSRERLVVEHHYYNRTAAHIGNRLPMPPGDVPVNESVGTSSASFPTSWATFQAQVSRVWDGLLHVTSEPAFIDTEQSTGRRPAAAVGFSFSPAGLLLPYHLGVAACLKHFNFITPETPIAGASAGALAVVVIACDVSIETTMQTVYRVERSLRMHGAARRLHAVLHKELDTLLPSNASELINNRPGRTTIAYTPIWPFPRGQFVSHFTSVDDVKECLAASCNIPFYFAKWPTVRCRGQACVDGYFASRRNFGCPRTSAARDINILPFTPKSVRVEFPVGNSISPELEEYDEHLNHVTNGKFTQDLLDYLGSCPAPWFQEEGTVNSSIAPESLEPPNELPWDNELSNIESRVLDDAEDELVRTPEPGLASHRLAEMWGIEENNTVLPNVPEPSAVPVLKHSIQQLLRIALDATSDETIRELFDLGRSDAFRWVYLEHHGYDQISTKRTTLVASACPTSHHTKTDSQRRVRRWFSHQLKPTGSHRS